MDMSNNSEENPEQVQSEYEAETGQRISSNTGTSSNTVTVQAQTQQQQASTTTAAEPARPRDSEHSKWTISDKGFWQFRNYDNLLAEYKKILPRKTWKSSQQDPKTIADPFNGKQFYWGVNYYDKSDTYGVWGIEAKPSQGGGGSGGSYGGGKKNVWYNPIGCELVDPKAANALMATNEDNKTGTRYRIQNSHVIREIKPDPNNPGKSLVEDTVLVLLVLEKRIEYGQYQQQQQQQK